MFHVERWLHGESLNSHILLLSFVLLYRGDKHAVWNMPPHTLKQAIMLHFSKFVTVHKIILFW